MEKTSLEYFQAHTEIEKIINQLNPAVLESEHGIFIDKIKGTQQGMLPAWMFVEAVEQAPIAISITDKKANILYANKAFSKVTGYTPREVIGQNESFLSFKSTPRQVYYELWHTISRNRIWRGQLINKHKDGNPYLAELTIAPLQDSKEKITNYLGMHRDITDTYMAKKKLNNQKTLIESVINASSVAMVVLDCDNKVVLDNQQYKMLQSDLDQKEPAHLFLEHLGNELGNIREYLDIHKQGFNGIEIRLDNVAKHNTLWFSCSGKLFYETRANAISFFEESHEEYLLLSFTNITRQRQHQETKYLQSLKSMMAEEEQIRSIRETLLGTIHQVSQPMNQIRAAIQLMQQKNEEGALLDLMKQMELSCQQTVSTLNNCVPEISPTATTSINLNKILHEVLMLHNNQFLTNGIIIEWQPCSVLPNTLGAENKIRMMFKQLLDNAIAALSRRHDDGERVINITTTSNDRHVLAIITDNGPGIPKEIQHQVFQPFFTTQKMGGIKAGMGLVMCKEIVHYYHGTIEFDADYTDGCRVVISLPHINASDYERYDR